jgi:hypothetical protein
MFAHMFRGKHPRSLAAVLPPIIAVLIIMGLAACQSDVSPIGPKTTPMATLEGTVTLDGVPFSESVAFELRGEDGFLKKTSSTESGQFIFDAVEAGDYELVARPPHGYWTADNANPMPVSVTTDQNLTLPVPLGRVDDLPGSILDVYILNAMADSAGVAGATVDVLDPVSHDVIASDVTGSEGLVSFELAPGFYDVEVVDMPDGAVLAAQQPNPLTDIITNPEMTTTIVFSAINSQTGEGTLAASVQASGQPLAGVNVVLRDAGSGDPVASAATDADGRADFVVASGAYDVEITVPEGYELVTGQQNPVTGVWVWDNLTVPVGFDLWAAGEVPPGTLVVSVVDVSSYGTTDGDSLLPPVADVPVTVTDASSGQTVDNAVTDANGYARFSLTRGDYNVEIAVPGGFVSDAGSPNPRGVAIEADRTTGALFRLRQSQALWRARTVTD